MPTQKKRNNRGRMYPLLAVRLSEDQKNQLNEMVEQAREKLNYDLPPTRSRWLKNDVIFEGLMIGLPLLLEMENGKPFASRDAKKIKRDVR